MIPQENSLSLLGSRLPPWIRVRLRDGAANMVDGVIRDLGLNTVCAGAQCPNKHECFRHGTATFMILGDVCTRNCSFCAVQGGSPRPVDRDEPRRVAEASFRMGLRHVVITSVTRDDLPDGGSMAFAETVRALRRALPSSRVEVLVPDFNGIQENVLQVLRSFPDVFNHNLETVRRLQAAIRPAADYDRSLAVLELAARFALHRDGTMASGGGIEYRANTGGGGLVPEDGPGIGHGMRIKSGIMVGLGETDEEIWQALSDLRAVGCELVTIGQYLSPSRSHFPVARYVPPEQFNVYGSWARELGYRGVAAAPLVRSSYHAEQQWDESESQEAR